MRSVENSAFKQPWCIWRTLRSLSVRRGAYTKPTALVELPTLVVRESERVGQLTPRRKPLCTFVDLVNMLNFEKKKSTHIWLSAAPSSTTHSGWYLLWKYLLCILHIPEGSQVFKVHISRRYWTKYRIRIEGLNARQQVGNSWAFFVITSPRTKWYTQVSSTQSWHDGE